MPYYPITVDWLRIKISELRRVIRKYVTEDEWDTYWSEKTEDLGEVSANILALRDKIDLLQANLRKLQLLLDAKS